MVGPGKGIDTNKYFVICSNFLGGCSGTTGPSSINPATGKPYGLDFPIITIADMVKVQKLLLDKLGIKQVLSVIGGSMGGMQVLKWAIEYPDFVRSAIPIATTTQLSAQSIAFDAVGRNAILADPNFADGQYHDKRCSRQRPCNRKNDRPYHVSLRREHAAEIRQRTANGTGLPLRF